MYADIVGLHPLGYFHVLAMLLHFGLYKAIAVLDLKGFRMEHLKLMDLIKKANAVFAWHMGGIT